MPITVLTDLGSATDSRTLSWTIPTLAVADLIVVSAVTWDTANTLNPPSGTGLSFTQRVNHSASTKTRVYIWTAVASSGGTNVAVTSSVLAGGACKHTGVLTRFPAAEGYTIATTPNTATATFARDAATPTTSLTGTAGNIAVIAVGDWDGSTASNTWSPAGTTQDGKMQSSTYSSHYYGHVTIAGSSTTVGLTAPTTGAMYTVGALEISKVHAAYGFNEGTGTTAREISGGPSITGIGGWATGRNGNAFYSTQEGVAIDPFATSTAFTIMFDVYIVGTGGAGYNILVADNSTFGYLQEYNTNVEWYPDIGQVATIANGVWKHVAVSADGTNRRLFVEGVLEDTQLSSSLSGTDTLYVGGFTDYAGNMRIDNLRIFKFAMTTAAQVSPYIGLDVGDALTETKNEPLGLTDSATVWCTDGTYVSHVLDLSPTLYLRLGETSGTNAVNEGSTSDGTYSGSYNQGISTTIGDGDTATQFQASSTGTVAVPHDTSLNLATGSGTAWSIVFRARVDGTPPSSFAGVMTKGGGTTGWLLFTSSSGTALTYKSVGTQVASGTLISPIDTWYHIAITNDGSNLRWYRNGSLINTTAFTTATAPSVTTAVNLAKGDSTGNYHNITLDEFAIFNGKTLTATQVSDLWGSWTNEPPGGENLTETKNEPLGLTDSNRTVAKSIVVTPTSDALGLDDTHLFTDSTVKNEPLGLADSYTLTGDTELVIEDDLGLSDTPPVHWDNILHGNSTLFLTDAIESVLGGEEFTEEPTDAEGLSDSATVVAGLGIPDSDALGLSDSASLVLDQLVVSTDDEGLADSSTVAQGYGTFAIDAFGLADTSTVSVGLEVSDVEAFGLADSSTVSVEFEVTTSDAEGLADSSTVSVGRIAFSTEALGLTDSATVAVSFDLTQSDPEGLADTSTVALGITSTPSDAEGLTDSATVAVASTLSASDALGLAETTDVGLGLAHTHTDPSGAVTPTVSLVNATASGSGTTSWATTSFTPTTGDLLFVCVYGKGSTDLTSTLTSSANGITWYKAIEYLGDESASIGQTWVANQLVGGSPVSMTVTWDCSGDAADGVSITVGSVSGMTKVGSEAVAQSKGAANNLAEDGTPSITFDEDPRGINPVVAWHGNNTNPAGTTPPTDFTELVDQGFDG